MNYLHQARTSLQGLKGHSKDWDLLSAITMLKEHGKPPKGKTRPWKALWQSLDTRPEPFVDGKLVGMTHEERNELRRLVAVIVE